jgi:uncharacterized protein (DUF362 family)
MSFHSPPFLKPQIGFRSLAQILRTLTLFSCLFPFQLPTQAHGADIRSEPTSTPDLPTPTKSRVIISENPELVRRFQVNDQLVAEVFNKSLLALTGKKNSADAWKQFVSPEDIVGIKVNTAGGAILSSKRSLVDAIVAGLQSAGVKPSHILVWDRYGDQMLSAGYIPMEPNSEWQCLAVQPGAGFDSQKTYFNEVVGQLIWGDRDFVGRSTVPLVPFDDILSNSSTKSDQTGKEKKEPPKQISNRSYYTTVITQKITKLINIPVLSDHQRVGLYGSLSSLALASVDNHRRFQSPEEHSGLAIAEILSHDVFKGKTVLHVMDGLVAQFAGGPEFVPNYTQSPGILMLSRDPVALDTLALEKVEAWRKERSVVPVGRDANHIAQAARSGLGTNQREQMEIISIK